jgi:hypothetical protein
MFDVDHASIVNRTAAERILHREASQLLRTQQDATPAFWSAVSTSVVMAVLIFVLVVPERLRTRPGLNRIDVTHSSDRSG